MLLNIWSNSYIQLYGAFHATLTYHLVRSHLVDDVINHGSLIGHQAYSLEGVLGQVTNALSGTRGFSNQFIKSKYCLFRKLSINKKYHYLFEIKSF